MAIKRTVAGKTVVVPRCIMVGRGRDTEKLYKLEEQRQKIVRQCAAEWAKVTGTPETEFWTTTVPQQLFDILESWERASAVTAAEAFVEYARTKWPDLFGEEENLGERA